MLTFETFGTDSMSVEMRPVKKKPIIVHAAQVHVPFRVKSLEGDYAQGKPGDYLMRGVRGEQYICDKEIFEESYDFVG